MGDKSDAISKGVEEGIKGLAVLLVPMIRTWVWSKTYREVLAAALRGGQSAGNALDVAEKASQVIDRKSEEFAKDAAEKVKKLDKDVREALN